MINIKKFDSVALSVKEVLQQEALKGDQHKIDKNKNNKIDAHDFKILRGEKKGMKKEEIEIEEGTESKADYHDRMHRLAAHYNSMSDEKKASLGKIPGRAEQFMQAVKYAKDNPNMKKEEAEQIDELRTSTLLRYQTKANKALIGGDRNKEEKRIKGIQTANYKIQSRHKVKEEAENVEESNNPFDLKNYKSQLPTKPGEKAGFDSKKISTGTVYSRKPVKDEPMKKEEVEQVEERTLTKGETSEKERIVKGMKKSLKGFKARYGDKAKSVMYATATKAAKNEEVVTEAKRPESDTVPFITNGDSLPLQHAKNLAKKSMKRMKSEMMGKTGTSE